MIFNILTLLENNESNDKLISSLNEKFGNINTIVASSCNDILKDRPIDILITSQNSIEDKKTLEIISSKQFNNCKKILISDKQTINTFGLDFDSIIIEADKNIDNFISRIEKIINILKIENRQNDETLFINKMMDITLNPIFVTDGEKVTFCNKSFLKITNSSNVEDLNNKYKNIGEIFTKKDTFIYHETENTWISKCMQDNLSKGELFFNEKEHTFLVQIDHLQNNNTYLVILNDITNDIQHEKELLNLLYTDNLTKLPNRVKLIQDLQNDEIGIKSLAIIDLNSFKEINDFYGNRVGDFVLKSIAELIEDNIDKDIMRLYKFPADTYSIAYCGLDKEYFSKIIKDIVIKIDKKVFPYEQHEIDSRATAGISFSARNNKLITADLALQAAKKDNKDYLVFYDKLDNLQEYKNNMLWTKKLKNALVNDNIVLFYQPLINNKTMKVDKYECLVRMIDEDKIISPFFFLDISKKSNQYTKLTKIVIEKSFREFENLPFEFSVNISYEDIEDPTFLEFIKNCLKEYDVSKKVVFEILEDEGVKNYDILIEFIDEVKALGCKVAIDDFGSGYSNFEHLLKMNVDYLKIDASLIKNIATSENSYKVTKTIIEFAKSLNLKTIAEYVENKEIFEIIKELGTDYSQGYYFSAPVEKPNIYYCK